MALGASIGAMAKPFLEAAQDGTGNVVDTIEKVREELRIIQFVCGAASPEELRTEAILRDLGTGEAANG